MYVHRKKRPISHFFLKIESIWENFTQNWGCSLSVLQKTALKNVISLESPFLRQTCEVQYKQKKKKPKILNLGYGISFGACVCVVW